MRRTKTTSSSTRYKIIDSIIRRILIDVCFMFFFFVHQKLHVILCEFNAFRRKRFLFHILCACAPYFYFVFLEQTVCRPLEKIARKTFVQIHRSKQVYVESQCCCCCCDFDLSDNVFIPCAFVNISIYSI